MFLTEKHCMTKMVVLGHKEFLFAGGIQAEPVVVITLKDKKRETCYRKRRPLSPLLASVVPLDSESLLQKILILNKYCNC